MNPKNNPPKQSLCSIFPSFVLFSYTFLLCQHGSVGANLSNQTDQHSLLELKRHTSDDPHNFFNSWNNTLPFCQWQGVTCGIRHQRVIGLNLSDQNILGTISPHLGNLSFLMFIDLQNNRFHGEIPQQIGRLFRLRILNLTNNVLGGRVPVNMSRCQDLRSMKLKDNRLVGSIPAELGSLKMLYYLNLNSNNLTGFIPRSLGNLSSLTDFFIHDNNLEGPIPIELGQLTSLTVISIGTNNLSGMIPSTLYNISTLTQFGVVINRLSGTLPPNIGLNLPNLQGFFFGDNYFHGEIPVSFSNATHLKSLDMSTNQLTGQVPANLGYLKNLQLLNIGNNLLGSNAINDLGFITSLSNCSRLNILGLDRNNFGGQIPNSVGNLSVRGLALAVNHIVGQIPSVVENLGNLYDLQLQDNSLSGSIPSSLGKLGNLQSLPLEGNKLSGLIPSSLGNLSQLFRLSLAGNQLEGNIPESIGNCTELSYLDLSENKLNGSIPKKIVSIFSLSVSLNLAGNYLSGSLPPEVGELKNINFFVLSNNKLTGNIPETIRECLSLEYLYMDNNFFEGIIPLGLADLKGIRELDLSRNNLSGQIPSDMEKLIHLEYLNLSFNNLDGEVPKFGVFTNTSAVSVVGNTKLCGGIKELELTACRTNAKKPRVSLVWKILIIAFGGAIVLFSIIIFLSIRSKARKGPAPVDLIVEKLLRISYQEIYRATEGFSSRNLIGSGSFGTVYRGMLNQIDGKIVAVKVLNLAKTGALKSFTAECRALRNIRHRNLVKILTYCSSIDFKRNQFKALVYDFMENGSLDMWLHPQVEERSRKLSLLQRMNIAIDVANAIQYLHDLCEPPIIHCDLKPSNILLNNDLIAHVGDFGLARILPKSADHTFVQSETSSMGIKGSIGYAAPEYGMGGEASKYGDIYSYGVLLLEMLTGKRPTDEMFKDGLNLRNYVRTALEEEHVMMSVDPTLFTMGEVETGHTTAEVDIEHVDDIMVEQEQHKRKTVDLYSGTDKFQICITGVMEIGLGCSAESPKERISINDVISKLHHIRTAFLADRI